MNIRPKSASTTLSSAVPAAKPLSQHKPSVGNKKIDMGAAANFGKKSSAVSTNAAGIHSPTHRDTPAESSSDLIGYSQINFNNNNTMGISTSSHESNKTINSADTNTNNNALDSLFKTCSPKSEKTLNSAAIITDDMDDFNPRAAEAPQQQNEFGDFASAFGGATAEPPSASLTAADASINDDFADFSSFQGSSSHSAALTPSLGGLEGNLLTSASPANDAFDLFNSSPAANHSTTNPSSATTSLGATIATDLLAGLGDLSIHQSMPMGEFNCFSFHLNFEVSPCYF